MMEHKCVGRKARLKITWLKCVREKTIMVEASDLYEGQQQCKEELIF